MAASCRFRCSRTKSTLRSGSRNPPFSARPDLNLNTPCVGANAPRPSCWRLARRHAAAPTSRPPASPRFP
ncbi:hypothetical protein EN933_00015 [Mesorhizobium sp. M7A.F.Ca.US.001.01.1.1]|nr:hypothetical protein EN933_00015 [Mesorhizobium sp. M7A.F.Ca.US.001.01.1.1]